MSSTQELDKDLPLMSNTNEILVRHFMFDFACNFDHKCFACSAVLFLEPVNKDTEFDLRKCQCDVLGSVSAKPNLTEMKSCAIHKKADSCDCNVRTDSLLPNFVFILDCHQIIVNRVEEINLTVEEMGCIKYSNSQSAMLNTSGLNHCVGDWCLKIWKEGARCRICFPRVIKIMYTTVPEGSSLLWVKDQDGRPSVFTYGAWINNRSLYPCQEPPVAMATWEATVSVSDPAVVLMSGDTEAVVSNTHGMKHYYYCTKSVLPMSTLALAIGYWDVHTASCGSRSYPSCRILAPPSLLLKSVKEFWQYLVRCIKVAEDLLGPYPFPRIDLLIVPKGFGSLGMASPNIIFLSQSLLAGDRSMCSRLAHEVAHAWFGLLIGAKDWTEEWLSEGFATFMEDYIHINTVNFPTLEGKNFCEVKSFLRLQTLKAEVETTSEELQVLRINKGKTLKSTVDSVEAAVVKNGMNPEKGFLQAHYIKGYFLLKHLSDLIGIDSFMQLLKDYVQEYRGQLVESKAIFKMFKEKFPDVGFTEEVFHKWLHDPGIIDEVENMIPTQANNLFSTATIEGQKWRAVNTFFLKKTKSKRRKISFEDFNPVTAEQKNLILESLLEEEKLAPQVMKLLDQKYFIESSNAEVRHRWCELVVKHRYKPGFPILEDFLKNDLAMGVYLYGELILSGIPSLKRMGKDCYFSLKSEMEPNFVVTIEEMLKKEC